MSPESWGFIGALCGAVVGASASIITTFINSKNAIQIQKEIAKNAQEEQFRRFQRENLLDLQELLGHIYRLVTRAQLEDLESYRKGVKWSSAKISPKLDNDIEVSIRELSIKLERVDDDKLRDEILRIKRKFKGVITAVSYNEAEERFVSLNKYYDDLASELGEVLRANF